MALILILIPLLVKKSCFEPLEAHYAGEIAQLRAEVAGDDGVVLRGAEAEQLAEHFLLKGEQRNGCKEIFRCLPRSHHPL